MSASSQDGVTWAETVLPPKTTKKKKNTYKTMVFRHWTTGSMGQ